MSHQVWMSSAFFWNCAANSRIKHSSMSRPPTRSEVSLSTCSLPRTNWTMLTEKMECPMEQNLEVQLIPEMSRNIVIEWMIVIDSDRLGTIQSMWEIWGVVHRQRGTRLGYDFWGWNTSIPATIPCHAPVTPRSWASPGRSHWSDKCHRPRLWPCARSWRARCWGRRFGPHLEPPQWMRTISDLFMDEDYGWGLEPPPAGF